MRTHSILSYHGVILQARTVVISRSGGHYIHSVDDR
jgi:hypothetical protein